MSKDPLSGRGDWGQICPTEKLGYIGHIFVFLTWTSKKVWGILKSHRPNILVRSKSLHFFKPSLTNVTKDEGAGDAISQLADMTKF